MLLIVGVSLAFGWILQPFYGAVLWATVTAIMFAPLYRRLLEGLGQRRNCAAVSTVAIIIAIGILPLTLIGASLIVEASGAYGRIQSGDLDLVRFSQRVLDALPTWAIRVLDRFGLVNLDVIQERVSASLMKGSQVLAEHAINIGQGTFGFMVDLFVMLYLLFFLLRDKEALTIRLKAAIPLRPEQQQALLLKFAVVIRATIKGDFFVALLQGVLGGLGFWFLGINSPLLWGVVMAFSSLVPAVGAALIWVPAAIYLLATDALWQGWLLVAYGLLVIGLVDNLLRPILVGKDTKMPNYVVLISTLGGITAFGLNGLIIGPAVAAMFIAVWDLFTASRLAEGGA